MHDFRKNGYNCYLHLIKGETIHLAPSVRMQVIGKKNLVILRLLGLRFANLFHCCRIWTKSKCLKAAEICSFQNTNLIISNSMHYLLQTKSQLFSCLYISYSLTEDTVEPLYWRLAADLHHIPSGANWSSLIRKICAGAAEPVLVWQQRVCWSGSRLESTFLLKHQGLITQHCSLENT